MSCLVTVSRESCGVVYPQSVCPAVQTDLYLLLIWVFPCVHPSKFSTPWESRQLRVRMLIDEVNATCVIAKCVGDVLRLRYLLVATAWNRLSCEFEASYELASVVYDVLPAWEC